MKKQMIPALVGFWLGHVVTSVLLFGWMMLGILWYFMGTSDLWYDVTAIMIALLIPLMAGGLTRKKQPYIPVKSLWMAAGVDVILLALILAVYHGIVACGNCGLGATVFQKLLLDGTILATGVPLLLEKRPEFKGGRPDHPGSFSERQLRPDPEPGAVAGEY